MDKSREKSVTDERFPDDPDYTSIMANKETEELYSALSENSRDFFKRKLKDRFRKVIRLGAFTGIIGGLLVFSGVLAKMVITSREQNRKR